MCKEKTETTPIYVQMCHRIMCVDQSSVSKSFGVSFLSDISILLEQSKCSMSLQRMFSNWLFLVIEIWLQSILVEFRDSIAYNTCSNPKGCSDSLLLLS